MGFQYFTIIAVPVEASYSKESRGHEAVRGLEKAA